jgi:hypothetical protein
VGITRVLNWEILGILPVEVSVQRLIFNFFFKVEASEYVLQEDGQLHQVNRLAGENNVSVAY